MVYGNFNFEDEEVKKFWIELREVKEEFRMVVF